MVSPDQLWGPHGPWVRTKGPWAQHWVLFFQAPYLDGPRLELPRGTATADQVLVLPPARHRRGGFGGGGEHKGSDTELDPRREKERQRHKGNKIKGDTEAYSRVRERQRRGPKQTWGERLTDTVRDTVMGTVRAQ